MVAPFISPSLNDSESAWAIYSREERERERKREKEIKRQKRKAILRWICCKPTDQDQ